MLSLVYQITNFSHHDGRFSRRRLQKLRGPPLEYGGGWSFLEINIFGGKMGEINKWTQDMVEINILPTQEVEINIIKYWNNIYSLS